MAGEGRLLPVGRYGGDEALRYGKVGYIDTPVSDQCGLSASTLDYLMRQQWEGGKREGIHETQVEADRARPGIYEEGVADACKVAERQFRVIRDQLDTLLLAPHSKRQSKGFAKAVRDVRALADEMQRWGKDRPTTEARG